MVLLQVWRHIRGFLVRNRQNAVAAYSAQAALFLVISFFPFAIFVVALVPYLPFTETQILGVVMEIVPSAIADYARSVIGELYRSTSVSLLSVAAVAALWSASKGSLALIHGLNRIYGVRRFRGYLWARLTASLYVFVFFLLLLAILIFLGFGRAVLTWLSKWLPPMNGMLLKGGLRFFVSLAILFLLFWLMYTVIPQRRTKPLREAAGALFAAVGFGVFSSLFSWYLDNIGGISIYYGSLSLAVLSLLWLYFCMYILFLGAELNVWLQENVCIHKERDVEK